MCLLQFKVKKLLTYFFLIVKLIHYFFFLNNSERSTLGQGDIVKLKISEDNPDNTKKPEKAQSESGDAEDDLKSPSNSLNAKNRKHRKFTSGDNYEPFDELENIGFTEEPDSSLLFETNGYFFVHENCAAWSDGVNIKKGPKEEVMSPDKLANTTPEKSKIKTNADNMTCVDKAVKASINQKCAYCNHFGASVKCKASGKMYHFPCAAASGKNNTPEYLPKMS